MQKVKNKLLAQDKMRYGDGKIPRFQKYLRKYRDAHSRLLKILYKVLYVFSARRNHIEIPLATEIGGGLYIGHPFCITVNPEAKIGRNCNIHKGVTIGRENRGRRKGAPVIGDSVWIGVNATVVGRITVGDDVLIAPNTYVNCDIPSHSVVLGNPCVIRHRDDATENYINRKCES